MPKSTTERVTIDVPVAPISRSANCPLEIHMTLEPVHAVAWRSIFAGLKAAGETTAKGRPITTPEEALKWLLAQVGDRFDRLP